jgi:tetratricopeptide (TPR) repeat protein
MKRPNQWLSAAAILFLTFLAYQPVWHAGFIWDDDVYLTENPMLTETHGLRSIWFSTRHESQYFPLVYTTLRVERQLWGLNPLGYHLVNVLLHSLNALLVWVVLRKLALPGAWLAAAIFALHPVHVESVAWITELKNTQSTLFYLLALLAWMKFTDKQTTSSWRLYALALLLYALALFSKTTACTLPAALLLVLWLRNQSIGWKRVVQVAPFLVLGVAMGLLSVWWERHIGNYQITYFAFNGLERLLIASHAVWFYALKLVWPTNLMFSYPRWQINSHNPLQYVWLIGCVAVAFVLWFRRKQLGRGCAAAIMFFVATLSPLLGFITLYTFRYSFVADHYQYVASIGLIALFVAAASRLATAWHFNFVVRCALSLLLLLALGASTWSQAQVYRDLETLWVDTLSKNPDCWMAHNNLATVLYGQRRTEEAMRHGERALQLKPDDPEILNTLAGVYIQAGKYQDAIGYCERAMRVAPLDSRAYSNLGFALVQQGKGQQAIERFEQALRINPNDARASRNLAMAANNLAWQMATHSESNGGDPGHSVIFARRACELTSNCEFAYLDTFAAAYADEGHFNDAITVAQKAIELARTAGQTQAVSEITGRLEMYRTKHAYRESK